MVKYVFCWSHFNFWSKKPVTHTKPSHWLYKHSQWPSVSFGIKHQPCCWQKHVKIRLLVIIMVKYCFVVAASIIGVKKLSPTQTQVIGNINIAWPKLALLLIIKLVFSQKSCLNETASNYYGEIFFALAHLILIVSNPATHRNPSHDWIYKHSQWPSVRFWNVHQLGCWQKPCIRQLVILLWWNIDFCCSIFNYWSKEISVTHSAI